MWWDDGTMMMTTFLLNHVKINWTSHLIPMRMMFKWKNVDEMRWDWLVVFKDKVDELINWFLVYFLSLFVQGVPLWVFWRVFWSLLPIRTQLWSKKKHQLLYEWWNLQVCINKRESSLPSYIPFYFLLQNT